MKSILIPILSLILGSGSLPVMADEQTPKITLESANKDVKSAQDELHLARQNYLNATRTSGPDSPEALSAKKRLDSAHSNWQAKMTHRQQVRHQARHDMAQGKRHP